MTIQALTMRFGAFALVFLASAFSFATSTVSGTLNNLGGAAIANRTFVRFSVAGCGGNQPRVNGTALLAPNGGPGWYKDFTPNASGVLHGSDNDLLYRNDTEIECGGSLGVTWYSVSVYRDGKAGPSVQYSVTSASFDLNSATPNTTSPVVSAPTGDSTYQRLDGGNSASGNYVPAVNGTQALGSSGSRWDLFANDITANATITSTIATGTAPFTIASTTVSTNLNADKVDGGDWAAPNAIGTGTPAAGTFTTITGNTSVASPILKSSTANTASAGQLRLAVSDAINFRNNANGADVNGTSLDSSDRVVVGGSAGISVGAGIITSASAMTIGPTINTCTGCATTIVAANKFNSTAGSVTITAGSVTGGVGNGGSITLNPGTSFSGVPSAVNINGQIGTYNSIALVANGMASEVAAFDATGQTAAISTATLYAVPAAGAGQYRLSWNAKVTTAAGTSSTLGALTVVYTDPDGVAITVTAPATISAGTIATTSTANTTGTVLIGIPLTLNCKASTNITYAFAYASNAAAAMNFNLHLKLEAM